MDRKVYFQGVQRRPANQQQNDYMQNPIPHREYPQFKEFSPQANAASRAYGMALIITKPIKSTYTLKTPTGRQIYENNRIYREFFEEPDGSIEKKTDHYYNDTMPQENLTLDGFTYHTSPKDYVKYLKDNQIPYEIKKDNLANSIKITDFTNEGEIQETIWHSITGNITRQILNSQGQEIKSIIFEKDKTTITDYFLRQKIRNYDAKQIPQETITPEQITSKTSPEEYIEYLEQNNINYKIIGSDPDKICILETNEDGKKRTLWTNTMGEFVPIRTYYDKNGEITENIVFYKDTTRFEYPEMENIQQQ